MGAALSIAGSAAQSGASAHEAIDMAHAFQTEQTRQNRYRTQALGNMNNLTGSSGYGAYQQDSTAGAANRMNLYNQLANTKMSLTPTSGTGDARDVAAEQLAGSAQAKLGGYSDYNQAQNLRQLGNERQLGQIGDFAAGTASVFPYRMYEAQHGWDWLTALGQGLGAIGGAFGGGSGSSTNFGGGGPAAGTGGNLSEYSNGFNPNVGASDQSIAGPYTYYQVPPVMAGGQANDSSPYYNY